MKNLVKQNQQPKRNYELFYQEVEKLKQITDQNSFIVKSIGG